MNRRFILPNQPFIFFFRRFIFTKRRFAELMHMNRHEKRELCSSLCVDCHCRLLLDNQLMCSFIVSAYDGYGVNTACKAFEV